MDRRRDAFGIGFAIHRQSTACGYAMLISRSHNEAARGPHLPMHQTHGVLLVIIRTEGVGAYHLTQITGLMGKGLHLWAHFVNRHRHAKLCCLPCRFATGHAAADDV